MLYCYKFILKIYICLHLSIFLLPKFIFIFYIQDKYIYHTAPVEKPHGRLQTRTSRSQKKKSKSPERSKYCVNAKNYEQPTISSKSHSPSPYTKRRMCELSEDTRRRLAHLNLGPYEFKKETDKPPFVIRHVCVLLNISI